MPEWRQRWRGWVSRVSGLQACGGVANQHTRMLVDKPKSHTSALNAPFTYAAESRSGMSSEGLGSVGKTKEIRVHSLHRWTLQSQMDAEKRRKRNGSGNRSISENPGLLHQPPCEFSYLILPQLRLLPNMPVPATIAPC